MNVLQNINAILNLLKLTTMKNATLYVLFALCFKAYSQNKPMSFEGLPLRLHTKENVSSHLNKPVHLAGTHSIYNDLCQKPDHQILKPNTLIQLIDSFYVWQWDTIRNGWVYNYKSVNRTYDANNNLKSQTVKNWNGSAWVNDTRNTYTFDMHQNMISDFQEVWKAGKWENQFRTSNSIDAKNNISTSLIEQWNISAWENWTKDIYTYDVNNLVTTSITQFWNVSKWVNGSKLINGYDSNKNLISFLFQLWNGSTWENQENTIYTYNATNNLTSILVQSWVGNWINSLLTTYTFDANNVETGSLNQNWNGSSWDNAYRRFNTYNGNKDLVNVLQQSWTGTAWILYSLESRSYDANHFLKNYGVRYFNETGKKVESGDSTYYYFHTVVTGIADDIDDIHKSIVYPNPSDGEFTYVCKSDIPAIEILNLIGTRIYAMDKIQPNQPVKINLSNCSKGIYLLREIKGTKSVSKRIVIE